MTGTGPGIRSILIVGGTIAGWMTAAVLGRSLPASRYAIRLVESPSPEPELETLGGGLASLPSLRAVHGVMGLEEQVLVQRSGAEFSLGAEFAGWTAGGRNFFRPFAPFGASLDGVAFHNFWLRMRRSGGAGELEEYSLGAVAAKLGRFAFPSTDPGSVLSTLDYGYHLDGASYRDLLRAVAEQHGVARVEGEVGEAQLHSEDGHIEALTLEDGQRLAADFFIDCSGAKACLIEGALGTGFEDWRPWLACDRAVATTAADAAQPAPYMRAEAAAAGWQWRMPLQHGTGHGYVYSGDHLGDDEAAAALPAGAGGDPRLVRFASGRRTRFWNRNCVAIGASGCVIDPLEPTALRAIQRGISLFLTLMPFKDEQAGEADEYDRIMIETVERMRDLVILHYKANGRSDSPFWVDRRAMAVPEVLAYKMRLFEAKGRVLELDEDMFQNSDWVAVYLGQGIEPRAYDALADMPDRAVIRDRLAAMRKAMRAAAEAMPAFRPAQGAAR